ncbi:hypothetical protein HNP40_001372 [Mycobacteroides chelonae]|nr:hypothetical protein [Mycobacteroides chelonae]
MASWITLCTKHFCATRSDSPPSFFITTCDGRLSIHHPAWVAGESDPTVAWSAALRRAFDRVLR